MKPEEYREVSAMMLRYAAMVRAEAHRLKGLSAITRIDTQAVNSAALNLLKSEAERAAEFLNLLKSEAERAEELAAYLFSGGQPAQDGLKTTGD